MTPLITNLLTPLIDRINKKSVLVIFLIILIILFTYWLVDAIINGSPNYSNIIEVLKVFQYLLPVLLEGLA